MSAEIRKPCTEDGFQIRWSEEHRRVALHFRADGKCWQTYLDHTQAVIVADEFRKLLAWYERPS